MGDMNGFVVLAIFSVGICLSFALLCFGVACLWSAKHRYPVVMVNNGWMYQERKSGQ